MKQTCLVLGAGASCPYGFPAGRELKTHLSRPAISASNNGVPGHDKLLLKASLLNAGFDERQIESFQSSLKSSTPFSIDRFLELRSDFEEIGKVAIATAITFYEARCRFNQFDHNDHLYRRIYQAVFPTPPQPTEAIRILTFNYDRSLEQYFMEKLCVDTTATRNEAQSIVAGLRIQHVHGTTGVAPQWPTTADTLRSAAQSIRVLHESSQASKEHIDAVRNVVQNASRIVFLGFGYDVRNLQLLDVRNDWRPRTDGAEFEHPPPPQKTVYGSCKGMTHQEIESAASRFNVHCGINPEHREWDALKFVRETGILQVNG